MNRNTFKIKKNTKIIVYGAAYLGHIFTNILEKQGYEILCFIDSRADEIDCMLGKPVYSIEEAKETYQSYEPLVIIAVKNVFEHSKIANQLIKAGFKKFIYKPREILDGKDIPELNNISTAFDTLQAGENIENLELICTENAGLPVKSMRYLVEEKEGEVTVMLPIQMLFQDRKDFNDENDIEVNVMFLFPHIEFFQYLQGIPERDCQKYVDYCKQAANNLGTFQVTKAWEQNVIRNRAEVYEEMNKSFLMDREFFYRGAPRVTWNKNGYFNLNSGKHRATFFASKGLAFIPVKMSKGDRDIWLNQLVADRYFDSLIKQEILEIPAPIEHPNYYDYSCGGKSFFENLLFVLARECSKEWYDKADINFMKGRKIYIDVLDNGYLSRFFRRIGCLVYTDMENDMEKQLDNLTYIKTKNIKYTDEIVDLAIVENMEGDITNLKIKINSKRLIVITEDSLNEKQIAGGIYSGFSKKVYLIGK